MKIDREIEKNINNLAYESRILTMEVFHNSGMGGHYGGCFSSAEVLTVLYNVILKIDPKNPEWEERDYFILSKGHISALYSAVLALRGFFDKKKLLDYDELNSAFGMHTTLRIPGCEFAGGSLGHGLSVGVGIALAKKLDKFSNRVFVHMGDGELNEGSVWEAAMSANKYKLDNLIATIDRNMLNMEGKTEDIMPLEPLEKKWEAFGWAVKTVDGHNIQELFKVFNSIPLKKKRPTCIILKTVKGKGIKPLEGNYKCHHVVKINDVEFSRYRHMLEECKHR